MTDYMTGFGGHFESEAVDGALPEGRNSPQRPAFGLYVEQVSGSAFTAPRHENLRSWLYRMRPTADHRPFVRYEGAPLLVARTAGDALTPNRLRWNPPELPEDADFVDGLATILINRAPEDLEGVAVHVYRANKSMMKRVFVDADGVDGDRPPLERARRGRARQKRDIQREGKHSFPIYCRHSLFCKPHHLPVPSRPEHSKNER